jgi:hypothetical protein
LGLGGCATARASKARVGGCADVAKTVDVTDLAGSMFVRLPGNS